MNFVAPKFASKRALEAKDPLLKYGHHNLAEHQKNLADKGHARHKTRAKTVYDRFDRSIENAVLILFPFLTYVATLSMVLTLYHAYSVLVYMMFFTMVVFATGQYLLVTIIYAGKPHEWQKWIGCFSALAAFAALIVGILIHYEYMVLYRSYHDLLQYDNIEGQHSALQFEDGGIIEFAGGGKLDTSRAVGYRDIRNSRTLCLAPIIDSQMSQEDEIAFFAVGIDCCNYRASFQCDDAARPTARGGLLKLEPSMLAPPYWEWAVGGGYDKESFEKAVDLQKSVFAANVAKHHRFIQWLDNPEKKVERFKHSAWEIAIYSCILFLAITIPIAVRDKQIHDRVQEEIVYQYRFTKYQSVDEDSKDTISGGV